MQYLKDESHLFFDEGQCLLHWLFSLRIPEVVLEALNIVDDINTRNHLLKTPLHLAVIENNLDIVKHLLNKGADVNAVDIFGDTPLHWATYNTFYPTDIIMAILQYNPKLDIKNKNGLTALMNLCFRLWSRLEVEVPNVSLLLVAGSDITIKSSNGLSAIDYLNSIYNCVIPGPWLDSMENAMQHFYLHSVLDQSMDANNNSIHSSIFTLNENTRPKWNSFARMIHEGLSILREVELGKTSTTMRDIALAPVDKLVRIFSNRRVMDAAIQCEVKTCRILDDMVKYKIELARRKRNFIYNCIPYLGTVINFPFPMLCLANILEFLDFGTMQNILLCYTQITGESVESIALFEN